MAKRIYIAALLLFAATVAQGQAYTPIEKQNVVSEVLTLSAEDYLSLVLPPLSELLENARSGPTQSFYNKRIDIEKSTLKSVRRDWLTYLRLIGSYQYGMTNDYMAMADIEMPQIQRYTDKLQSQYLVGLNLAIPLSQIFDRRNKVTRQKSVIALTELEGERTQQEIDIKIIDAYTSAVENLTVLRTMTEAVTVANAQYKVTEQDFINGRVDAQVLSRQKNIQAQSFQLYEQVRSALNNALLRLELYSNTKIVSRKTPEPRLE